MEAIAWPEAEPHSGDRALIGNGTTRWGDPWPFPTWSTSAGIIPWFSVELGKKHQSCSRGFEVVISPVICLQELTEITELCQNGNVMEISDLRSLEYKASWRRTSVLCATSARSVTRECDDLAAKFAFRVVLFAVVRFHYVRGWKRVLNVATLLECGAGSTTCCSLLTDGSSRHESANFRWPWHLPQVI